MVRKSLKRQENSYLTIENPKAQGHWTLTSNSLVCKQDSVSQHGQLLVSEAGVHLANSGSASVHISWINGDVKCSQGFHFCGHTKFQYFSRLAFHA